MIVHVKDYKDYESEPDFDELDHHSRQEARPRLAQAVPSRRAFPTRNNRVAPILDTDDDFDDFDVSAFVERTYQ